MTKPSSIRSFVLIEHRLVPYGRTQAHGQYRGCKASRGKNDANKMQNIVYAVLQ